MISKIAAANEQQRLGIEQINFAISGIDRLNQENSRQIEELANMMNRLKTGYSPAALHTSHRKKMRPELNNPGAIFFYRVQISRHYS